MLNVITWCWGDKYGLRDIDRLCKAVKNNLKIPHQFHVFCDKPFPLTEGIISHYIADPQLTGRHCFCRLRMFDPRWQNRSGLTGTIVSLDLDVVITGVLDPLFTSTDSFMILQGANASNPNPFNASVMMLQAGHHPEVWSDFSLEKASAVPFYEFPDDQGWIWHKLPLASGWKVGASGIYAFQKPGWPKGNALPPNARIVSFIGWRKPQQFLSLPWVQKYWNEAA